MIVAEYKDADQKVKRDIILNKMNSFQSSARLVSTPATTSNSLMPQPMRRERSETEGSAEGEVLGGEGKKRKISVTLSSSSTTLSHSEYQQHHQLNKKQQQQQLSTATTSLLPSSLLPSVYDTSHKRPVLPDSSVASSFGEESIVSVVEEDPFGNVTPSFPSFPSQSSSSQHYQNPLVAASASSVQVNHPFYSQANSSVTSGAAETPEFPPLSPSSSAGSSVDDRPIC